MERRTPRRAGFNQSKAGEWYLCVHVRGAFGTAKLVRMITEVPPRATGWWTADDIIPDDHACMHNVITQLAGLGLEALI
ncbi:hypothetical protein MaudCBS49596_005190, partial [Microsporum audouinii]